MKKAMEVFAGISAIITFFGFLLSILLHMMVFSKWHIDFLQIATPSDVLMSGIWLTIEIGSPIVVSLFMVVFVGIILIGIRERALKSKNSELPSILNKVKSILEHRYLRHIYVAVMTLLMIFIYYIIDSYYSQNLLPVINKPADMKGLTYLLVVSFTLLGAGGYSLSKQALANTEAIVSSVMTGLVGFFLFILYFIAFANVQATYGFERNAMVFSSSNPCGGQNRVLWLGGDAVVIECLNESLQRLRIIVLRGGDATLRATTTPR